MHLIFLHGAPGVGKRTVAAELSNELQFPFVNFHHLASLLGPVFGYGSDKFDELRDSTYHKVIGEALTLPEDGVIASFTYEPSIDLERFAAHIQTAKDSGGIGLFIGLTCDSSDLKARTGTSARGSFEAFESAGGGNLPPLPGPSISLDTSGESPQETVQNILAMLPDEFKENMVF